MGRRSQHTPDELKELILGATRRVIETGGFQMLSAREIARAIGYAPGTLYNMFQNLDEILMRVETRILDDLDASIAGAIHGKKDVEALKRFASAYVEFAYDNPRLWELVLEHHPATRTGGPDWYLERLYAPIARLQTTLGKLNTSLDPDETARSARLIWSAIHGIVQVATTGKFGPLPRSTTVSMAENLVTAYAAGMSSSRSTRRDDGRRTQDSKRERHPD